jgi:hypothetical protein
MTRISPVVASAGDFLQAKSFAVPGLPMFSIPGFLGIAVSSTTQPANTVWYEPWYIAQSVVLDQMAIEVTTAQASSNARIGLYRASSVGQPTSLVVDAGSLDTSTTGVKTVSSMGVSLSPGVYLAAILTNNSSVVFRAMQGASIANFGVNYSLGTNLFLDSIGGALAFGALPASGIQWATVGFGNTPATFSMFCKLI